MPEIRILKGINDGRRQTFVKKWLIAFAVHAALVLADGALTYYNTPDLANEGNPLVSRLNLGWGALITINLLLLVAMFFLCRFVFEKYQTIVADVPNVRSYISQLWFNRPDKFAWTFYKLPKNWKPVLANSGYAIYFAFCAGRLICVLEWVGVSIGLDMSGYYSFRDKLLFGRLDILVACVVGIAFLFIWYYVEYRNNQKLLAVEQDNVEPEPDSGT